MVEANPDFAVSLRDRLVRAAFGVQVVERGNDALAALGRADPGLFIVDVQLPDLPATVLCTALRYRCHTPVLVVNANRRRIAAMGLWRAGADAYVADPTRLGEIVARSRALIRRAHIKPAPRNGIVEFASIQVDPVHRTICMGGQPVTVTPREFHVLRALVEAQGQVVTRQALFDRIWVPRGRGSGLGTVDTHVARLRKKLEADGHARIIVTVTVTVK